MGPINPSLLRSRVVTAVLNDPSDILEELGAINAKLDIVLAPIIKETQRKLSSLEGLAYDSLEANQRVAAEIQRTLNRLGIRVKCFRSGCNEPSVLECRAVGGARNGIYQTRHAIEGRHVFHASSTKLPCLKLVAAPSNLRRRIKKKGK